ncbi:hypothetical protein GCM10027261_16960 [Geodermatophilus arenarius]
MTARRSLVSGSSVLPGVRSGAAVAARSLTGRVSAGPHPTGNRTTPSGDAGDGPGTRPDTPGAPGRVPA